MTPIARSFVSRVDGADVDRRGFVTSTGDVADAKVLLIPPSSPIYTTVATIVIVAIPRQLARLAAISAR
jgi:hypothetical protein